MNILYISSVHPSESQVTTHLWVLVLIQEELPCIIWDSREKASLDVRVQEKRDL